MFNNATRAVVVHSTGVLKNRPQKSHGVLLGEYAAVQESARKDAATEIKLARLENEERLNTLQENVVRRQVSAHQIAYASNTYHQKAREALLLEALTDIYANATPLDDEFVIEHFAAFEAQMKAHLDEKGGYKLLEASKKSTPFLTRLYETIEQTALEATARARKEMQADGVTTIDFCLNDKEKEIHAKKMEDLSTDQIADLVRQKVITVVKDEKARQQKEQELEEDIAQKIEDAPEAAKENLRAVSQHLTRTPVKEMTLFGALMSKQYRAALENIASVSASDTEDGSEQTDPEYYNTNADSDDVSEDEYEGDLTAKSESRRHEKTSDSLDMDLILAESIGAYALMETFHTIGLDKYDHNRVKSMVNELIYA